MTDSCPIPVKKQRTDNSPESSDNEDLNLSRTFDEDYQMLMDEEILKICKPSICIENLEISELLPDFISNCDELLEWIKNTITKSRFKCQCYCDSYLEKNEKICCIKRLFESPRFTNINSLANVMISNQPHLAVEVKKKLDELQNVWKYPIFDIDLSFVVKDIKTDIDDLQFWLKEIKEKLDVQIDKQWVEYNESIENILIDFKVHSDISNSITKTIEKVIQLDSLMEHKEILSKCKITLNYLRPQIHEQWLKAMELKYKLEIMPNTINYNPTKDFTISLVGQESGFESEISPMNPIRDFPRNNICLMKYISSSGECVADNNTTDLPMDSESTDLLLDFTINRNISKSSSLVEIMLNLPRYSQNTKNDVNIRKKQKRFKKRRQVASKSIESYSENLTIEEREKYLQIRNAFNRQSYSLKRRISTVQATDRTDATANRISDLAAAAEKIVMRNDFNLRKNSFSESPKESEIDDSYDIVVSSANDLNVNEVWDNYQVSLYSNDDGDSQILEVDKIKDWEQDLEIDDQNYEFCCNDKTLQFLTSGYETSMESDMHFCRKNLLNILKFSTSQQLDVSQQIDTINKQLDSSDTETIEKMNSIINEQLSISNTHVKLLNQILNSDPCGDNRNETLMKEIRFLQIGWENLIKKSIFIQSKQGRIISSYIIDNIIESINKIDCKVSDIKINSDLNDLKSAIDILKEHKMELLNVNAKIVKIHSDSRYALEEDIKNINNRINAMIDKICMILNSLNEDYEIMKTCMKKLIECQKTRKKIEIELKCFTLTDKETDWKTLSKNVLVTLENNKEILNTYVTYLSDLSTEKCYENMKSNFDEELGLLDELNLQLRLALPVIDNLKSKMDPLPVNKSIPKPSLSSVGGLLNRLPVQVAIVVIIAICGWWYKQQSTYLYQDSSDWFKLIRKYTNNMEPH